MFFWQACRIEIGNGKGSEATLVEIATAIDLNINKNCSASLQQFKNENAQELDRAKQILKYWSKLHTIEF